MPGDELELSIAIARYEDVMTITLFACSFHPRFAHGTVRDIRARWAFEETGLAYETRLVSREELATPEYRAIHPFGKILAIADEDGVVVFESAAIILALGERSEVLLPRDCAGRTRATAWICAAGTTLEGPVSTLVRIDFFTIDRQADLAIRPASVQVVRARLTALSDALGEQPYLDGRFSGTDIMMRSVLDMPHRPPGRVLGPSGLIGSLRRPAGVRSAMRDHLAAYQTERA